MCAGTLSRFGGFRQSLVAGWVFFLGLEKGQVRANSTFGSAKECD
jgi:hypothetical protein